MDSVQILSDRIEKLEKRLDEHGARIKACEDEILKLDGSIADLTGSSVTSMLFNCESAKRYHNGN